MDELRNYMKETMATVFSFYLKTHSFHWNVEGPDFAQLHSFFGDIYDDVYGSVDPMAEHLRTLEAYAPGSFTRFQELSYVKDELSVPNPSKMLEILLADNNTVINCLVTACDMAMKQNLQGLVNFLADRIDMHKKWAWQLRAFTKNKA